MKMTRAGHFLSLVLGMLVFFGGVFAPFDGLPFQGALKAQV